MRGPDSRVENVSMHAGSGLAVGVAIVQWQEAFACPVQACGRVWLDRIDRPRLVGLDIGHARDGAYGLQRIRRQLRAEPDQRRRIRESDLGCTGQG